MFGGPIGLPELIILALFVGAAFVIFKLPKVVSKLATTTAGGSPNAVRQNGKFVLGGGVLLLVFAAMRWNSTASQISRAFGGNDPLAILLFLAGAIGVWSGYKIVSSTPVRRHRHEPSTPAPRVSRSRNQSRSESVSWTCFGRRI